MAGVKGRSGGKRAGAGRPIGIPMPKGVARGPGFKPFEPTKSDRNVVSMGKAAGLKDEQIASMIMNPATGKPICLPTLLEQFKYELETGHQKAVLAMASSLYRTGMSGNVAAMIFWLKTRARWSERVEVVVRRPDEMSDEELDAHILAAVDDEPERERAAIWSTATQGESSTQH